METAATATERTRNDSDTSARIRDEVRLAGEDYLSRAAALQPVLESMSDGVFIGNAHGITIANQPALEQIGYASLDELNRRAGVDAAETEIRDTATGDRIPTERLPFVRALGGEHVVQEVVARHRVTHVERILRCVASPVVLDGRVIAAVVVTTDVTDRVSDRQRGETERDALRRKLLVVEDEERRRLARELHDEVGQHLTAIGLGLQTLADVAPPNPEIDRRANDLRRLVATMARELHSLAVRLRPKALNDFGLEAALLTYADEWSARSRIKVDLHAPVHRERLPAAIESAVYRIVQEALTNVARHSRATCASVAIERRDGQVVVVIEDDGVGFEHDVRGAAPSEGGGLGLVGMQERAALLRGSIEIESAPGRGTSLFVRIPIERESGTGSAPARGFQRP